jgi:sirohydrochlorin ferrochelatase
MQRLEEVLTFPQASQGQLAPSAVVVPLLAGPHPVFDAALAAAASRTSAPVMLASHLGPHPLLAEAVHARLAEAGLVREGRAKGLSIVTGANGVLVLADRGDEAIQAAGVIAVLLAGRLAVPVAPASVGDPASVDSALTRLREAGVSSPAIAPCVIGPEKQSGEIQAIADRLGAPCARLLGAHPAIPQLVAIRYGAALADLSMASSPA